MLQGDTRNLPLPNLLQSLALNQQEGVLAVTLSGCERRVALRGSSLTPLCDRSFVSDLLPDVLARLGILTPGEYQNVVATCAGARPPGDILIERHLLSPELVLGPVREHLTERIYELFQWVGARYKFEVRPVESSHLLFSDPELDGALRIHVNSLLMEVARREDEWQRINTRLDDWAQIYRLEANSEQLATFKTPDALRPERRREILTLFNGERTLAEIVAQSTIPHYYICSTLRALLEFGLTRPITVEEKKVLAERLRHEFQLESMFDVYRSILGETPDDLDVRKKLILYLERKKSPDVGQLLEHYTYIARHARRAGDTEVEREHMARILQFDPHHLESLGRLCLLSLDREQQKEWLRNVRRVIASIRESQQLAAGAHLLVELSEARGGDATLLMEAAGFFAQCGEAELAGQVYAGAAQLYERRGDIINLRKVTEILEGLAPEAGAKYRGALERLEARKGGPRRGRSAVGITYALLLLLASVGAGVTYEWKARIACAEAVQDARQFLADGRRDDAEHRLDVARRSFRFSLASGSLPSGVEQLGPIGRGDGGGPGAGAVSSTPPRGAGDGTRVDTNRQKPAVSNDVEAILTRAAGFASVGRYEEAYDLYAHADLRSVSRDVANQVQGERQRLWSYLEAARGLRAKADRAERSGDHSSANRLLRKLADSYPFSPEARDLRIPILLEVVPSHARVRVAGEPVAGPPFIARIRSSGSSTVQVECPSFEEKTFVLDGALDIASVRVELQRTPSIVRDLEAPIEARPLLIEEQLFVGVRSGHVVALDTSSGEVDWRLSLQDLGEVAGALHEYQGDVVFASTDGTFYRVDRRGRSRYRTPLPDDVRHGTLHTCVSSRHRRAYMATGKGLLIAVDLDSGLVAWSRAARSGALGAPIVLGETVIFLEMRGHLRAYDAETGEPHWECDIGERASSELAGRAARILLGTAGGQLQCRRVVDGELLWSVPTAGRVVGQPLLTEQRYFCATADGGIVAGHVKDGEESWSESTAETQYERGPVLAGDALITEDTDGVIRARERQSGELLWTYRTDSRAGAALYARGEVIVHSGRDHRIHILRGAR